MRHAISICFIVCAAALYLSGIAMGANTFYVSEGGDNGGDGSMGAPWRDIQYAIDQPGVADGDTIMVMDGTYRENVDVTKGLTIQSVNGRDNTVVWTSDTDDHVFEITADNVTIEGFQVHSASGNYKAGFYLGINTDHCTVSNNRSGACFYGLYLYMSDSNTLSGNISTDNTEYGIRLYSSYYNHLFSNVSSYNSKNGIHLNGGSNYNKLRDNTCRYNDYSGIEINASENNELQDNFLASNIESGISIVLSSTENRITQNNLAYNKLYGIHISSSSGNYIYFNEIEANIVANVQSSGSINIWHTPRTITYKYVGGSATRGYLGNYYDDHGATDADMDGINDTPYDLPGTEPDDTYALYRWLSWYEIIHPVLPGLLLLL